MTAAPGHRIRLRGPWSFAWIDEAGNVLGEPQMKKHPDDWPAFIESRGGRMELTRTFHAPSNIDPDEAVFLVLTGVCGAGTVRLNDSVIGEFHGERRQWEFSIPLPLPFFNRLVITVEFPAATASKPGVGVYDEVALEIRKTG